MGDGAGTPILIVLDVTCPVCRRFIGKVEMRGGVSGARVWINCRDCGKWRWCQVGDMPV